MKLVSVLLARSVWLFDFGQFNPKGLNLWPLCEWLIERYRFAAYPKNVLDLSSDEKALAFKAGSFVNSRGENVLVSLSIYANGIIAEASSSTDDAEEFLQQAAGLIYELFGMKVPPNAGRAYVSQCEIESQFSLSAFKPELAQFAEALSATVATVDGKSRDFDFGVLQLWSDDTNPTTAPALFRFERKIGLPFSSNRYFSQAALKTHEHLEFLDALENIFKT
jgi:hypothetical protein